MTEEPVPVSRVTWFRQNRRWPTARLAQECGISPRAMELVEREELPITSTLAARLSNVLHPVRFFPTVARDEQRPTI